MMRKWQDSRFIRTIILDSIMLSKRIMLRLQIILSSENHRKEN